MDRFRFPLLLAFATVLALPASAQTLYKLIDKNGKVTYAEKPPNGFDGKVIRMDIDPNANTAVLPKPGTTGGEGGASRDSETLRKSVQDARRVEDKVERARETVARAKANLQNLIDNAKENDVMRMGKVGGGSRPVLSEEYQARIAEAEAQVKVAEEELARIEGGR